MGIETQLSTWCSCSMMRIYVLDFKVGLLKFSREGTQKHIKISIGDAKETDFQNTRYIRMRVHNSATSTAGGSASQCDDGHCSVSGFGSKRRYNL